MPGHRPDSPEKFSWVFENRPLGTRGAFFKIPIFTWASGAPSKLPRVIFDVLAWAGKNARVFFEYFLQKSLPGTPLPTLPLVKMHRSRAACDRTSVFKCMHPDHQSMHRASQKCIHPGQHAIGPQCSNACIQITSPYTAPGKNAYIQSSMR